MEKGWNPEREVRRWSAPIQRRACMRGSIYCWSIWLCGSDLVFEKKNVVILLCRWCLRLSIDFVHGLSCRSILQALVVVASQQLVQMVTVFFSGYMGVDLVLGLIVIGMLGSFSVFV